MTIKQSGNRHSIITKFTDRTLSARIIAKSTDSSANEYTRADLLSNYGQNGRIIGIGRRYNGESNTPASKNYISLFIERYNNDRYFYKEINTNRARNNEELLTVYRKSETELYFTIFEKTTKRLILNYLIVENTGSNTGASVGYNEITVSLSEQWIDSYCRSGGTCNIVDTFFSTDTKSQNAYPSAGFFIFYSGSTKTHISKTYSKDVGFVAARTDYKYYCWTTDSANPLDSMTMSYTDIT